MVFFSNSLHLPSILLSIQHFQTCLRKLLLSIYNTNSTLQELSLSQTVHLILMNILKKKCSLIIEGIEGRNILSIILQKIVIV